MKELKSHQLAFTYAGCFIGAGFLSGQELWQFFGSFGKNGAIGLVLAVVLQAVIGFVCISYASKVKTPEFEKLIIKNEIKSLRTFFVILELLTVFSVISVMFAGVGSLFDTVFYTGTFWPSLIFTVVVALISYFGLSGVVKILNGTVPILTATTVVISVIALAKYGFPTFSNAAVTGQTFFMPNFVMAFILFAVYNVFCILCITSPLGCLVNNQKTILKGIAMSSAVLLIIAFSVIAPLYANPVFAESDLPMLVVSKSVSGPLFYVYALLLLMGIFGTSISSFVSIIDYVCVKSKSASKNKFIIIIPLSISAFILSRFGFSTLISILYPVSGYIGCVALILLTINYFKQIKTSK